MIAAIALNSVFESNGRVAQGCADGLKRLKFYGYRVVIEVDTNVQRMGAVTIMERHDLPFDTADLRGGEVADFILDRRQAGYRGWRAGMGEVDEMNRNKYREWLIAKDAAAKPAACPIPTADSADYHPLEDCAT